MKPLLLTALLALAAPAADAGGLQIDFGFRHRGERVRVRVFDRHGRRARHRYPVLRRPYECREVWVPARYETVRRRVRVAGRVERFYQPAVYETHYDRYGYTAVRVLVRRGYWTTTRRAPGHFVTQVERVRREGYFERICNTPGHRHAGPLPIRHRRR